MTLYFPPALVLPLVAATSTAPSRLCSSAPGCLTVSASTTCATLLLRQGVNPKFVQELLGHRDVSLTRNTYSHVLPDMGDVAASAMDEALG